MEQNKEDTLKLLLKIQEFIKSSCHILRSQRSTVLFTGTILGQDLYNKICDRIRIENEEDAKLREEVNVFINELKNNNENV